MLKRQRPLSPPPGPSAGPVFDEDRDSKRRRTAAPVLDGGARGWATQPAAHDDDEDYVYSDDELDAGPPHQPPSQSEYTSTNTMLRELHTLHQHRLLFASAPPPPGPLSMPHATPDRAPAPLDKGHLRQPGDYFSSTPAHLASSIEKTSQHAQAPREEATRVAELYEGTNKYLGSLFLSRRRALDPSDEIPGT